MFLTKRNLMKERGSRGQMKPMGWYCLCTVTPMGLCPFIWAHARWVQVQEHMHLLCPVYLCLCSPLFVHTHTHMTNKVNAGKDKWGGIWAHACSTLFIHPHAHSPIPMPALIHPSHCSFAYPQAQAHVSALTAVSFVCSHHCPWSPVLALVWTHVHLCLFVCTSVHVHLHSCSFVWAWIHCAHLICPCLICSCLLPLHS